VAYTIYASLFRQKQAVNYAYTWQ